ncbi:MarR family winged helix-turn-helix transcriptional regulator [Alkalihalobacillus pseudalcaliphilus]|uniref:MarR family winged helix-turn-helix transcriptional regulator n=1 Tax=Alkalihalobacillus pseudalcaliphilus TaxID=79884 RepID=UPI00064DF7F1|nr:MarR family transcriptional regulator [Alkalihalobacillus pseudalcaliphilus]KMK76577.1 hypothetical protein AB990_15540 [Alkalihalobacillus pseudalcaliphilus]
MLEHYREILLEMEASIHRLTKYILPQVSQLSQIQLTKKQETILFLMLRDPEITMKKMAEYLNVSKSAVTQMVDKLEEQDLIKRQLNPDNRREWKLIFGEKGVKIKTELEKFEKKVLEDYFTKIPLEDLQHVVKTMHAFEEVIQSSTADS